MSASSWGCELKYESVPEAFNEKYRQPLREAVSWNNFQYMVACPLPSSASSWGCELKSFWNIRFKKLVSCQPLREAVSWNAYTGFPDYEGLRQPLREAVSWNNIIKTYCTLLYCQPLREAVSWNFQTVNKPLNQITVSLFVRLWVEIRKRLTKFTNSVVSLFVRLWVEIFIDSSFHGCVSCQPLREAVSWNTLHFHLLPMMICQPLREAVSWNRERLEAGEPVRMSASSWGCELKYLLPGPVLSLLPSASSWGCELKYQLLFMKHICGGQPLREAVSWNAMSTEIW